MRLLQVSSDRNYNSFLCRKLSLESIDAISCTDLKSAKVKLDSGAVDVVVCNYPLGDEPCPLTILKNLRQYKADIPVIFTSDNIQIHTAMALMREGVSACLNKPFPFDELKAAILKLRTVESKDEFPIKEETFKKPVAKTSFNLSSNRHIRGNSVAALNMYKQIDLVGPTNFSVIVYGETGTGKESVASKVAQSANSNAPYIAVDCGCLSKELALSELFGHEKGSFTGAVAQKTGAFELANGGTLFLDEIGNLDYEVQGYLLRAIQERKIRRLGGVTEIKVQARIVVASNENLHEAVQNGKFREDLYHRLNEFEIVVPSLRERKKDIALFVQHFLQQTNQELDKNVHSPVTEVMLLLENYPWPGNIRELRNIVRRACLMCADEKPIEVLHLPKDIVNYNQNENGLESIESGGVALPKLIKARDITISKIKEVLKKVNYNKTLAAKALGIDRKTLYNKLNMFASKTATQPTI